MSVHTIAVLSISRFAVTQPSPRNTMVIDFRCEETCQTFSFKRDGRALILQNSRELPTIRNSTAVSLADFLSNDDPSCLALPYGSSFPEIESLITCIAYEEAREAASIGVDALGVKAELTVSTELLGLAEFCETCLVDFEASEAKRRTVCGHLCHEECLLHYKEWEIECPSCYYGLSKPLNAFNFFDSENLKIINLTGDLCNFHQVAQEDDPQN